MISIKYSKDGSLAIFQTAKAVYEEEVDRFKQIETKTNFVLTFLGVYTGIYLTFVYSNTNFNNLPISYIIYNLIFKTLILALIILSFYFSMKSLRSETYEQVNINNIVVDDFVIEKTPVIHYTLAGTYLEAVNKNKNKIEKKLTYFDKGQSYINWSLALFVLHFIIEVIIKNA